MNPFVCEYKKEHAISRLCSHLGAAISLRWTSFAGGGIYIAESFRVSNCSKCDRSSHIGGFRCWGRKHSCTTRLRIRTGVEPVETMVLPLAFAASRCWTLDCCLPRVDGGELFQADPSEVDRSMDQWSHYVGIWISDRHFEFS